MLEGPGAALAAAFARIGRDPRHGAIGLRARERALCRLFPGQALALRSRACLDADLARGLRLPRRLPGRALPGGRAGRVPGPAPAAAAAPDAGAAGQDRDGFLNDGIARPVGLRGTGVSKKVLVATSAGGHWVQMRRLLPAFEGCELLSRRHRARRSTPTLAPARYYRVAQRQPPRPARLLRRRLAARPGRSGAERPDAVITTGAAPGLLALALAKLAAGSRTSGSTRSPTPSGCPLRAGWRARSPTPG